MGRSSNTRTGSANTASMVQSRGRGIKEEAKRKTSTVRATYAKGFQSSRDTN